MRAIFTERVDGVFALRRGFALEPGERVAVIEDVVTTGKSTREVLDVAAGRRAPSPSSAGRSSTGAPPPEKTDTVDGVPYRALLALDVPAWEPAACPLCARGEPLVAPGSRHLAAKA